VLDYDLICKSNPKWGLVSLALGPDGHLKWLRGHFPLIQKCVQKKMVRELDTRCALPLLILSPLLHGGRIGGRGCGGQGGPLPSRKQPKAPLPLPPMSCCNKQADLLLSRCQGAMIEALRPLLVFSRISSTMMQPSLSSSFSALAAKTGEGGRSDHSCRYPHHHKHGEGTGWKSKSSTAAATTATSTLTGLRVMDQPMREDDIKAGVPLTMTMMTKRNSAPQGSWHPPDGIRIGRGWGEPECQQRGQTIIAILTGKKLIKE
jgi:hypothetical protein